mgnify:CR=1 FL=1
MKIKLKNIEVINLTRELYGTVMILPGNLPPRQITKGILAYPLNGVARKRLNRLGLKLKEENQSIEDTKAKLLETYGKKIGDQWVPIARDEKTGDYKSKADEKKAKAFEDEMTKILEDTIEVEVDLLDEKDLPTTEENYEITFTKLVKQ